MGAKFIWDMGLKLWAKKISIFRTFIQYKRCSHCTTQEAVSGDWFNATVGNIFTKHVFEKRNAIWKEDLVSVMKKNNDTKHS